MAYTEEELNASRQAAGVGVAFCDNPECHRPHVVLLDEKGKPFAHFVVPDSRGDGTGFMKDLQDAMYRSAVERKS